MKNLITPNFLKLTALFFLLAGFITACSDNDPVAVETEPSIADITASTPGFETLNELIEIAGLEEVLQGGEYTVFAPTDDAFAAIPEEVLNALTPAQITDILLFHTIPTAVSSAQLQPTQDVTSSQGEVLLIQVEAGTVIVNGAATVQQADIEASNGVIHVIDTVLMPSGFREASIVDLAAADGRFTTLLGALESAGLTTTFTYLSPFTVFAPTDDAFAELPDGLLDSLSPEQLTEILQYHVVGSAVASTDLSPRQAVPALNEENLFIVAENGTVTVNGNVEVIIPDLAATNGVVHAVDRVLLPNEFLDIVGIVSKDYNLTALVDAVVSAGLVETLQGDGPFTVFAPTNEAFQAIESTVQSLTPEQLAEVLTYHVVPDRVESGDLQPEQTVATVNGQTISIEVNGSTALINDDSQIIETDRGGSNGVVHIIDTVLIPDFD